MLKLSSNEVIVTLKILVASCFELFAIALLKSNYELRKRQL
jgi:hypothetical protein